MKACALVLGAAACCQDDIKALRAMVGETWLWSCHVIGVSRGGVGWTGRLDHWATLHPEDLPGYIQERDELGYGRGFVTWSRRPFAESDVINMIIPHWGAGGSGLFGCTVAKYLGIERAILCGIPTDPGPHMDGRERWDDYEIHQGGWLQSQHRVEGWVRSMSGWTADLLGRPTPEWLNGGVT